MESGWGSSAATAPSALGRERSRRERRRKSGEVVRNWSWSKNHTSDDAMKRRHEHEEDGGEGENDENEREVLERRRHGREERSDEEWIAEICALRPSPDDARVPREDGDGDEKEEEEEEESWKESAERDHHAVGRHPHRQPCRAPRFLLVVVVVSDVSVVVDVFFVVRDAATARGTGDGRTWFTRSPAPPARPCR
jgi:hypothetical protein